VKTTRQILDEHSHATRDIELTEAAIGLLERVGGTSRVIATLKRLQQKQLDRIDRAAAKLGAPYGS
jgi:hypothetical protein